MVQRWATEFSGQVAHYAVASDGGVLGRQAGSALKCRCIPSPNPVDAFSQQAGHRAPTNWSWLPPTPLAIAFLHSGLGKPAEVYLAEGPDKLQTARPLTAFNKLYTERDLPQGKPYRWKAEDGATVEGMLMYPPGKFEAKNLPMFVLHPRRTRRR